MRNYKDIYLYDLRIPEISLQAKNVMRLSIGSKWKPTCGCDECTKKCYRKYKTIKKYFDHPEELEIRDFSNECISYSTGKRQLEYYVYVIDNCKKEIVAYNIFNSRVLAHLYKAKRKYYNRNHPEIFFNENKDKFLKEVKDTLMWCYWAKYEWEVSVDELNPRISYEELDRLNEKRAEEQAEYPNSKFVSNIDLDGVGAKIDPYYQVVMNWNIFTDYLLSNIDLIKKPKINK